MPDGLPSDCSAALERIRAVTGCRTQTALADFLGISQSSVSDAQRRGIIPAQWLLKLLRGQGINPDWVLTGEGARRLRPDGADVPALQIVRVPEVRPPEHCSAQELVNELVRRALAEKNESGV